MKGIPAFHETGSSGFPVSPGSRHLPLLWYALGCSALDYKFNNGILIANGILAVTDAFSLCKTCYPLLMVHGVGFRDLRYFNYCCIIISGTQKIYMDAMEEGLLKIFIEAGAAYRLFR